jgi:hypothetical protein
MSKDANFVGLDEFVWWKGVVEDRKDPLKLGRARVRIFGLHTEDKQLMPTENLPWAIPILPLDEGKNAIGPKEGDWVVGFYLDGQSAQVPAMFGKILGIPEEAADPSIGYNDPTPDELLVPGSLPRPPEFSPVQETEDGEETTEALSKYKNPDQVPGNNTAFGVLRKEYDPKNYRFDVNNDGVYNALDASLIRDPDQDGIIGEGSSEGDFFSGEVQEIVYPMSRYPLEPFLNEPETSRLARNEKIEETIVAKKKGQLQVGDVATHTATGVGSDTITTELESFGEPETPYNAKYPYNHVFESESGHVIEIDDTPGAERLHHYHRSGTFQETHPDGTRVEKTVKDHYKSTVENYYHVSGKSSHFNAKEFFTINSSQATNIKAGSELNLDSGGNTNRDIGGDLNSIVEGNVNSLVKGKVTREISGDLKETVKGNVSWNIDGNLIIKVKGNVFIEAEGTNQVSSASTLALKSPGVVLTDTPLTSLGGDVVGESPNGSDVPNPIVQLEEEDEDKKAPLLTKPSPPKEGFVLDGPGGYLYKPVSDSDGKAVTLSPEVAQHEFYEALPTGELETVTIQYQHADGSITSWEVVRPKHVRGRLIERGVFKGIANGDRAHYRWRREGAKYPKQMFWVIGGSTEWLLVDSSVRHD